MAERMASAKPTGDVPTSSMILYVGGIGGGSALQVVDELFDFALGFVEAIFDFAFGGVPSGFGLVVPSGHMVAKFFRFGAEFPNLFGQLDLGLFRGLFHVRFELVDLGIELIDAFGERGFGFFGLQTGFTGGFGSGFRGGFRFCRLLGLATP